MIFNIAVLIELACASGGVDDLELLATVLFFLDTIPVVERLIS